ncbi:MAG: rhomboid family intramembrane serine protease [Puniceicoccaceae bacterium]
MPPGPTIVSFAGLEMLYDRPYMRQPHGTGFRLPMMGWILVVNTAVFVLQNVLRLFFGMDALLVGPTGPTGGFLLEWFALTQVNLAEFKIWTLLTYSLFHGFLFHLIANALVIFFVGRMVEMMIGGQALLRLYIVAVLGGGLFWALVHWGDPLGSVIGASAGALGILIYFCLREPDEPITLLLFFVIPVTVLPKWIGWGMLGLSVFGLAFNELGDGGGAVAHSAHLGGMAGAWIFYRYERWFRGFSVPRVRWGGVAKEKQIKTRYRVNVSRSPRPAPARGKPKGSARSAAEGPDLRAEVDRILDKINASGFGSLDDDEKETLNQAKEMLKR